MDTISYEEYLHYMQDQWRLSEHIGVVAPTGSGKSWIVRDLLLLKKHAAVIATKGKDDTLERYIKEDGFSRIDHWPPEWYQSHVLVWKKSRLGETGPQRALIHQVMDDIYERGGYVLYFDDLFFVSKTLHLQEQIQMLYTQVRSNGASLIASMQRPSWVPLEAVSQSTYILIGQIESEDDIKRVAAGMGKNWHMLSDAIDELDTYEFLLVRRGKRNPPLHIQRRPNAFSLTSRST